MFVYRRFEFEMRTKLDGERGSGRTGTFQCFSGAKGQEDLTGRARWYAIDNLDLHSKT